MMESEKVASIYREATKGTKELKKARIYSEGGDLLSRDRALKKVAGTCESEDYNYCDRIINAYLARLLPNTPTAATDLEIPSEWTTAATHHIEDVCTYGYGYLLVWDGLVSAVDPVSTWVGEDVGIRHWYAEETLYSDVYTAEELTRWVSQDDGKTWEPRADDVGPVVPNPYGVIPLLCTETSRRRKPVHRGAYGAQDMIVRTVLAHGGAIDAYGWPQLYALYEARNSSGTSDLGDLRAADQGSDTREEVTGLKRDPGSIWALRAKQIGQLDPASSADLIATLDRYVSMASTLSGVPARFLTPPGGQQPSGDSQRTLDADFRQTVVRLQGALGTSLCAALTLLTGVEDITLTWKTMEIVGDSGFWDTALKKQEAGVAVRQTLVEAGYTPEEVDTFMAETGDTLAMLRRVQWLNTLGDALGKLAAAVATEVIAQDTIDTLVSRLLGESDATP